MKKTYTKPVIQSEKMEIGVFGCYGQQSGPLKFIRPAWIWGVCCKG
ncbi:MAG: hypothetical protein JW881_03170 [Spirochaetales bacterium]|nr:hypothetical protein [Spirochaetales bacterium]